MSSSVGADQSKPGVYELITSKNKFENVVQKTKIDTLQVIPSNVNLAAANIELTKVAEREFYLKSVLTPLKESYDYIFIDSPPSLGLLTINGLCAADQVFIPLQCEYFALEGLSMLLQTIQRVQKSFNAQLKVGGILFTMYDSRTKLANEVVEKVSGYFANKVFRTIIPRNVRLSEAPSHKLPIILYDKNSTGAKSYEKLAKEVISRV
jgi:chromosome partitioning protein